MNEKQRRELGQYALRKLAKQGKIDKSFTREATKRAIKRLEKEQAK